MYMYIYMRRERERERERYGERDRERKRERGREREGGGGGKRWMDRQIDSVCLVTCTASLEVEAKGEQTILKVSGLIQIEGFGIGI